MPNIVIETLVDNEKSIVFDLARSVDLHKISTQSTHETVVKGRTHGLLKLNEEITWRAKHIGVYQNLTVKITKLDKPDVFCDEMISGAFSSFIHTHEFRDIDGSTLMIDRFDYKSPLGMIGRLVDYLFLKNYMTKFLSTRNSIIKDCAESNRWREILEL